MLSGELNEDDRESDVLESSIDGSENDFSDDSTNKDEIDENQLIDSSEDDINYMKFLKSVFENDDVSLGNSFCDDEDEEEYKPNFDEDEEDVIDPDLVRVGKREVRDLVDECWKTIAGESQNDNIDSTNHNDNNSNLTTNQYVSENDNSENIILSQYNMNDADMKNYQPGQNGHSLISSVITQLVAGEKIEEICIEGMPINAIRKLVIRQISMLSQLLLQFLLIIDNKLDIYSNFYSYYIELCNFREKSIRKLILLELNIENLKNYSNISKNKLKTKIYHTNSSIPLTRLSIANRKISKTNSIMDLPIFSEIIKLFELIDISRESIHNNINTDRCTLINLVNHHTTIILSTLSMRSWICLLPTYNYPLDQNLVNNFDSSSLLNRSKFTPIEDELLLRGLVTYIDKSHIDNDYPWIKIQQNFLPSKDVQSIQYRFLQMTSNNYIIEDNYRFKKYINLENKYKQLHNKIDHNTYHNSIKWTHFEDCQLLKGYQIYGEKWQLIHIFFLPTRNKKEIKSRWNSFQRQYYKLPENITDNLVINDMTRRFLESISDITSSTVMNSNNNNTNYSSYVNPSENNFGVNDMIENDILDDSSGDEENNNNENNDYLMKTKQYYKSNPTVQSYFNQPIINYPVYGNYSTNSIGSSNINQSIYNQPIVNAYNPYYMNQLPQPYNLNLNIPITQSQLYNPNHIIYSTTKVNNNLGQTQFGLISPNHMPQTNIPIGVTPNTKKKPKATSVKDNVNNSNNNKLNDDFSNISNVLDKAIDIMENNELENKKRNIIIENESSKRLKNSSKDRINQDMTSSNNSINTNNSNKFNQTIAPGGLFATVMATSLLK